MVDTYPDLALFNSVDSQAIRTLWWVPPPWPAIDPAAANVTKAYFNLAFWVPRNDVADHVWTPPPHVSALTWPQPGLRLPGVRCDARSPFNPAWGGLCLKPCGKKWPGDTKYWDTALGGSLRPWYRDAMGVEEDDDVGGPLGDTCACLAKKADWLGTGGAYSAYPYSLLQQVVAAGKAVVGHWEQAPASGVRGTDWFNATSLFQHHDFWAAPGGDVTGEPALTLTLTLTLNGCVRWRLGGPVCPPGVGVGCCLAAAAGAHAAAADARMSKQCGRPAPPPPLPCPRVPCS